MLTPAAAGAQYADSGSITMTSDPGDWVGGGRSYSYSTSGGLIQTQVDNQDSHLRVYYDDGNDPGGTFWYFDLAAPAGQALGVGVYTATEYPNQAPTEAGLHVHGWVLGSGHDCSTLTATFTISTWRLGPAGYFGYGLDYLQDFDATFEQHCEGAAAALRGTIHLANQPAPPMTVDLSTTQPGPMVPKDTLSFQTVLKPGDIDGDLVLNEDGRLVGAPSTTYAGTIVPYAATQGLHTYTAVFTPRNTSYPSVTSAPVTLLVLSSTPTLTLCSSPPNASGSVTLTTSGSPSTAGTVHFFKGTVDLGPADTTSGEVSTKTVQLGTAQSPQQLAAVFVAPDGTASATSGELDYTGQSQCAGTPGPMSEVETFNVNIPNAEGTLTLTVNATPVQLSQAVLSADFATFASTGQLGEVTISDNRNQSQPGWNVIGQVSDFTSAAGSFSGGYLGWTPTIISLNPNQDVVMGPALPAGTPPGLRGGRLLASATPGHGLGTTILGADLDLRIPSGTQPGAYSATLTITVIE